MDILRAENLCISFGGLAAVKNVSFTIPQNKIISLIGPNGAGKTTIFNIITGFYQADSGTVELCGEVINHISPERRIALGMARTFQNGKRNDRQPPPHSLQCCRRSSAY